MVQVVLRRKNAADLQSKLWKNSKKNTSKINWWFFKN